MIFYLFNNHFMKALITLLFIACSMAAFGQRPKTSLVAEARTSISDSISVKPNALQLEQLQQMEKQLQELNEKYQKAIELIVGVKREDIEKIEFKEGVFVVRIKAKK